jgi:hypothetical protein
MKALELARDMNGMCVCYTNVIPTPICRSGDPDALLGTNADESYLYFFLFRA